MNNNDSHGGWYFSVQTAKGALPPTGRWTCHGYSGGGDPPMVSIGSDAAAVGGAGASRPLAVGDEVVCIEDESRARALVSGHGGWVQSMRAALGKRGTVLSVDIDSDIKVQCGDSSFTWHPACWSLASAAARSGPCNSETLSVGDRVVGRIDSASCNGTVLGFRRQDGTRFGETGGGLSSVGCVRIDFDGKRKWNTTDPLHWLPVPASAVGAAKQMVVPPGRPTVGDRVEIMPGEPGAGTVTEIVRDDHDAQPYRLRGQGSHWYREREVRRVPVPMVLGGTAGSGAAAVAMNGFLWNRKAGRIAGALDVEEGGARVALRNETGGNDYHTAEGGIVMSKGRHQWNVKLSGTRAQNIKIGVVADGRFRSYNKNLYERQCPDPFLVYYCTGERGAVFDQLTGGPNRPEQPALGEVKIGELCGVIVDFNDDSIQFTRHGSAVGKKIRGIRGQRLRACVCLDYEGECATLESYVTTENYETPTGTAGGAIAAVAPPRLGAVLATYSRNTDEAAWGAPRIVPGDTVVLCYQPGLPDGAWGACVLVQDTEEGRGAASAALPLRCFRLVPGRAGGAGHNVRRGPSTTQEQVGTIRWGVHKDDTFCVTCVRDGWAKLAPEDCALLKGSGGYKSLDAAKEGWTVIGDYLEEVEVVELRNPEDDETKAGDEACGAAALPVPRFDRARAVRAAAALRPEGVVGKIVCVAGEGEGAVLRWDAATHMHSIDWDEAGERSASLFVDADLPPDADEATRATVMAAVPLFYVNEGRSANWDEERAGGAERAYQRERRSRGQLVKHFSECERVAALLVAKDPTGAPWQPPSASAVCSMGCTEAEAMRATRAVGPNLDLARRYARIQRRAVRVAAARVELETAAAEAALHLAAQAEPGIDGPLARMDAERLARLERRKAARAELLGSAYDSMVPALTEREADRALDAAGLDAVGAVSSAAFDYIVSDRAVKAATAARRSAEQKVAAELARVVATVPMGRHVVDPHSAHACLSDGTVIVSDTSAPVLALPAEAVGKLTAAVDPADDAALLRCAWVERHRRAAQMSDAARTDERRAQLACFTDPDVLAFAASEAAVRAAVQYLRCGSGAAADGLLFSRDSVRLVCQVLGDARDAAAAKAAEAKASAQATAAALDPIELIGKWVTVEGLGEGQCRAFDGDSMFRWGRHTVIFEDGVERRVKLLRRDNGKTPFQLVLDEVTHAPIQIAEGESTEVARVAAELAAASTSARRRRAGQVTVRHADDGSVYTGGWDNAGLRHGHGRLCRADGSVRYEGGWEKGLEHGSGVQNTTAWEAQLLCDPDVMAKEQALLSITLVGPMVAADSLRAGSPSTRPRSPGAAAADAAANAPPAATPPGSPTPRRLSSSSIVSPLHSPGGKEAADDSQLRSSPSPAALAGPGGTAVPPGRSVEVEVYEGEFHYGQRSGRGRLRATARSDGEIGFVYEGAFREGVCHGIGSTRWQNGCRYSGSFERGEMHGLGTFSWRSGPNCDNVMRDGGAAPPGEPRHGELTWTGEWLVGQPCGDGEWRWPASSVAASADGVVPLNKTNAPGPQGRPELWTPPGLWGNGLLWREHAEDRARRATEMAGAASALLRPECWPSMLDSAELLVRAGAAAATADDDETKAEVKPDRGHAAAIGQIVPFSAAKIALALEAIGTPDVDIARLNLLSADRVEQEAVRATAVRARWEAEVARQREANTQLAEKEAHAEVVKRARFEAVLLLENDLCAVTAQGVSGARGRPGRLRYTAEEVAEAVDASGPDRAAAVEHIEHAQRPRELERARVASALRQLRQLRTALADTAEEEALRRTMAASDLEERARARAQAEQEAVAEVAAAISNRIWRQWQAVAATKGADATLSVMPSAAEAVRKAGIGDGSAYGNDVGGAAAALKWHELKLSIAAAPLRRFEAEVDLRTKRAELQEQLEALQLAAETTDELQKSEEASVQEAAMHTVSIMLSLHADCDAEEASAAVQLVGAADGDNTSGQWAAVLVARRVKAEEQRRKDLVDEVQRSAEERGCEPLTEKETVMALATLGDGSRADASSLLEFVQLQRATACEAERRQARGERWSAAASAAAFMVVEQERAIVVFEAESKANAEREHAAAAQKLQERQERGNHSEEEVLFAVQSMGGDVEAADACLEVHTIEVAEAARRIQLAAATVREAALGTRAAAVLRRIEAEGRAYAEVLSGLQVMGLERGEAEAAAQAVGVELYLEGEGFAEEEEAAEKTLTAMAADAEDGRGAAAVAAAATAEAEDGGTATNVPSSFVVALPPIKGALGSAAERDAEKIEKAALHAVLAGARRAIPVAHDYALEQREAAKRMEAAFSRRSEAELLAASSGLPYNWEARRDGGPGTEPNTGNVIRYFDHSSGVCMPRVPSPKDVLPPPTTVRQSYFVGWQCGDLCEINFRGTWHTGTVAGVHHGENRPRAEGQAADAREEATFDVVFDTLQPPAGVARKQESVQAMFASWADNTDDSSDEGSGVAPALRAEPDGNAMDRLQPMVRAWHLRFPRSALGQRGLAVFKAGTDNTGASASAVEKSAALLAAEKERAVQVERERKAEEKVAQLLREGGDGGCYRFGAPISVLSPTQNWRECTVTESDKARVKIHYNGYHPEHDEWIAKSSDRLRLPAGVTALKTKGEPVPWPAPSAAAETVEALRTEGQHAATGLALELLCQALQKMAGERQAHPKLPRVARLLPDAWHLITDMGFSVTPLQLASVCLRQFERNSGREWNDGGVEANSRVFSSIFDKVMAGNLPADHEGVVAKVEELGGGISPGSARRDAAGSDGGGGAAAAAAEQVALPGAPRAVALRRMFSAGEDGQELAYVDQVDVGGGGGDSGDSGDGRGSCGGGSSGGGRGSGGSGGAVARSDSSAATPPSAPQSELGRLVSRWHGKWQHHGFVRHVEQSSGSASDVRVGWRYEQDAARFHRVGRWLSHTASQRAELQSMAGRSFEQKRTWFQDKLQRDQVAVAERKELRVNRESLLKDALSTVRGWSVRDFRKSWRIRMAGEEGIDAGGLSRAFFALLTEAVFNPDLGLFTFSGVDRVCYQVNPASEEDCLVVPGLTGARQDLQLLRIVGRFIGAALLQKYLMSAHLTRPLYKHIVGDVVTFDDLEFFDPSTFNRLV